MKTVTPITPSHRVLLDALKRRGQATVAELAADLDLNVETVREHLQGLMRRELVRRNGTARRGPGRPEGVFGLTDDAEALFPRREGEMLRALGAFLVRKKQTAMLGEFYQDFLAEQRTRALRRVAHLRGRKRLEEVARIFTELGFMPVIEGTGRNATLRMCHCPVRALVDATHVPCRAEIGLLNELLGKPTKRVSYIPDGDTACTYRPKPGT